MSIGDGGENMRMLLQIKKRIMNSIHLKMSL